MLTDRDADRRAKYAQRETIDDNVELTDVASTPVGAKLPTSTLKKAKTLTNKTVKNSKFVQAPSKELQACEENMDDVAALVGFPPPEHASMLISQACFALMIGIPICFYYFFDVLLLFYMFSEFASLGIFLSKGGGL